MSTLVSTIEVAFQEMARDPRSESAAESFALMMQAIDKFLTTPPITTLRQLEPEAKAMILPSIADRVRSIIERLRNMLSVAAQTEREGDPVSWAPELAEAIRRLESEFHYVPDISPRKSPPPIVRPDEGPPEQWRVEVEPTVSYQPPGASSTPSPGTGDESLDDILEDAMDLVRAQHTEAMSILRGEQPLDWEVVRRRLDELDKLDD
jgi:hypothetical protein